MKNSKKRVSFIKCHKSKIIGVGVTALGVGLIGYGFYMKGAKDASRLTGSILRIHDDVRGVTHGMDFIKWVKSNPDLIVKSLKK